MSDESKFDEVDKATAFGVSEARRLIRELALHPANPRLNPESSIKATIYFIDALIPGLEDLKSELTLLLEGDSCG